MPKKDRTCHGQASYEQTPCFYPAGLPLIRTLRIRLQIEADNTPTWQPLSSVCKVFWTHVHMCLAHNSKLVPVPLGLKEGQQHRMHKQNSTCLIKQCKHGHERIQMVTALVHGIRSTNCVSTFTGQKGKQKMASTWPSLTKHKLRILELLPTLQFTKHSAGCVTGRFACQPGLPVSH